MTRAMGMGLAGFGTFTATRRGSARTSIGLVTLLVGVVIFGSITDARASGDERHAQRKPSNSGGLIILVAKAVVDPVVPRS